MDTTSYRTTYVNRETATKDWIVIDAENEVLGRLASKAAMLLRGKYKPNYSPHVDCGDHVIIINADKVRLTGKKTDDKEYMRHSGYPGGQYTRNVNETMRVKPTFIVENAIRGMLPKSKLGRQIFRNLYVYAGSEHPHEAQKPKEIKVNTI